MWSRCDLIRPPPPHVVAITTSCSLILLQKRPTCHLSPCCLLHLLVNFRWLVYRDTQTLLNTIFKLLRKYFAFPKKWMTTLFYTLLSALSLLIHLAMAPWNLCKLHDTLPHCFGSSENLCYTWLSQYRWCRFGTTAPCGIMLPTASSTKTAHSSFVYRLIDCCEGILKPSQSKDTVSLFPLTLVLNLKFLTYLPNMISLSLIHVDSVQHIYCFLIKSW